MKAVARALYNQPVVFLGAVQLGVTGAGAAGKIAAWIPVATLPVIAFLQQRLVRPDKPRR